MTVTQDSPAVLEVRDLCTYFRSEDGVVKAVDGVTFSLRRGEVVGVVGESGSGKSVTSLSIMQLLSKQDAFHPRGQVLYAGEDLLRADQGSLRRLRGDRISIIFQDPMTSLNPYLTVGRQLTEVLELHRRMSRRQAHQKACEMLDRVGIADAASRMHAHPHQLSGGMRQRVMIAMALLCEPDVLIADEPTTALDVTIQAQMLALIRSLQRDFGTAVILITHDLGVVAGLADRVLVMYAGKIVEDADTDQLFRAPTHPYTAGLLAGIPRLEGERGKPLAAIAGLPPDLGRLPSGCPFRPRCPNASDICRVEYPARRSVSARHFLHCHNPMQMPPTT
jgi:oligopeptide/dipeptide ABC transporter ATP-binding protein